jgi:isoleucyl-tRNA synthetase
VPVLDADTRRRVQAVEEIILGELNVKRVQLVDSNDPDNVIVKRIKPNFRSLGPKVGKEMKAVGEAISALSADDIATLERQGKLSLTYGAGSQLDLLPDDVEISTEDIPGWIVASDGKVTVALDLRLSPELEQEGIARELVNRIQNLRKDTGLEVTDRIRLQLALPKIWADAVNAFKEYICAEVLATELQLADQLPNGTELSFDGNSGLASLQKD